MSDETIDALCRNVYRETCAFYDEIKPRMGRAALGFKILYGPPFAKPPILFIGYQPGGAAEDPAQDEASGAHKRWRPNCEYATERWPLAQRMQMMFGKPRLEKCVGLNAIFFRAPSSREFRITLDRDLRAKIESYCLSHVKQIIQAIKPQRIVVIGFQALALLDPSAQSSVSNEKGRPLVKIGKIGDYTVIGTLHLSGARISTEDRNRIRTECLGGPMNSN